MNDQELHDFEATAGAAGDYVAARIAAVATWDGISWRTRETAVSLVERMIASGDADGLRSAAREEAAAAASIGCRDVTHLLVDRQAAARRRSATDRHDVDIHGGRS